jgi:hypothetical protein
LDQSQQGSAPAPVSEEQVQALKADQPVAPVQKSKKHLLILLLLVVMIGGGVLAIWIYNETVLQKPLQRVLASDPRNSVVTAQAHFGGWIDTQTVVFDITDVNGNSRPIDVFRVFLQFARAEKEHRFKQVTLSAYGENKFIVPGDYFHQLGIEYDSQNPMYTIRTFPQHIMTMDKTHPFQKYDGGLFAVLAKEIEQFSDFNKQWYLNDYASRHK